MLPVLPSTGLISVLGTGSLGLCRPISLIVGGVTWVVKLMRFIAPEKWAYRASMTVRGGCRVTDRLRVLAVWLKVWQSWTRKLVSRWLLTVLLVT